MNVLELKRGERVILHCPESRKPEKRKVAVFDGIFQSLDEAQRHDGPGIFSTAVLCRACTEFLNSGVPWARFVMQTHGPIRLISAFRIDRDGVMTDEEGRVVSIEQRVFVGVG